MFQEEIGQALSSLTDLSEVEGSSPDRKSWSHSPRAPYSRSDHRLGHHSSSQPGIQQHSVQQTIQEGHKAQSQSVVSSAVGQILNHILR